MKTRHYIIYISGLGDHYDTVRAFFLRLWYIYGVKTRLVPMQWYGDGSYEQKVRQIKQAISAAQQAGYAVSLIGESAGASIALNVAAATPTLHRVVTLAGVNSSVMPISPVTRRRSPAFDVSAMNIGASLKLLDISRIHTISAASDSIVPARYSTIPGAHNHRIWSVGHIATIILSISLLSGYIVSIIKRPM